METQKYNLDIERRAFTDFKAFITAFSKALYRVSSVTVTSFNDKVFDMRGTGWRLSLRSRNSGVLVGVETTISTVGAVTDNPRILIQGKTLKIMDTLGKFAVVVPI